MFSLYLYMVILYSPFQNAQWLSSVINWFLFQDLAISQKRRKKCIKPDFHVPDYRLRACVYDLLEFERASRCNDVIIQLKLYRLYYIFCILSYTVCQDQTANCGPGKIYPDSRYCRFAAVVQRCPAMCGECGKSYSLLLSTHVWVGWGVIDQVIVRTVHHSCQICFRRLVFTGEALLFNLQRLLSSVCV